MKDKELILWPDPLLSQVSIPVEIGDLNSDHLNHLIERMFDLMYKYDGVGLSAVQIGVPLRVFVMDCSGDKRIKNVLDPKPMVFINPMIEELIGPKYNVKEGCLSFPGVFEEVERYSEAIISAYDKEGKCSKWQMTNLEAQCVQHENEHLNGILISDNWGRIKRDIAKRKIKNALKDKSNILP